VWIDMMRSWIPLAEKHNIKWFLMSGPLIGLPLSLSLSLLFIFIIGSVRHEGFVPYDPDIDIMLLPESFNRTVQALLEEEDNLSIFIERDWKHPYLKIDDDNKMFYTNLPSNYSDIPSYFIEGCKEECWNGRGLVLKVRHKRSCYGKDWVGGYTLDVFVLPPRDIPDRFKGCFIEGMKVPCPADTNAWLSREIGSDWLIPRDDPEKVDVLKMSNPFKSCGELKQAAMGSSALTPPHPPPLQ